MIEKITDQNLERYDSRLKEWCDRKFFEKGNYGKYQTTEEAGAVAFYPVPNTPLEGKVKFSFTETMPTEGDKGPNNPSTITGVSSINVGRYGKNLIPYPYLNSSKTENGVTFTVNSDGGVTVNGTATANGAQFYISGNSTKVRLLKNKTYFISGIPSSYTQDSINTYLLFERYTIDNKYDTNYWCYPSGASITPSKDCLGYFQIIVRPNRTVNNVTFYPQLEEGNAASEYEIPNLALSTISLGDTYYGGEIDLTTGIMTVTWIEKVLDRNSLDAASVGFTWNGTDKSSKRLFFKLNGTATGFPAIKDVAHVTCSHFRKLLSEEVSVQSNLTFGTFYTNSVSDKWITFYDNSMTIVDESKTTYENKELFVNWFEAKKQAGTPVYIVYEIANPFTVQLTVPQILSLTQSDKYTPRLNTVYTKADSVQISYLKSPIRDEYEKTQAILSLGGNS